MVNDKQPNRLAATSAAKLRQQAGELLDRLIADRELSEKRFAESGRRDPMKFITGRTALENAIASTREMISNMDLLLEQMQNELDEANNGTSLRSHRPQVRIAPRQPRPTPAGNFVPVPATGKP